MKGILPLLLLAGGFYLLRNVKRGINNLDIRIVDFKVNDQKSNITKITTNVKLEVLNPDQLSGTISGLFFTVKNASGTVISTFENDKQVTFNKQSRFYLQVESVINTGRVLAELISFFGNTANGYPVTIEGYVTTNLGRFNFIQNVVLL